MDAKIETTARPATADDPPLRMLVGRDDDGNWTTDLTHSVHEMTAAAFLLQAAATVLGRTNRAPMSAEIIQHIADTLWEQSPDVNGLPCPDCGQIH